jgi:hypothetical protein
MTSSPHISWAFSQRNLSLAQRMVLIALADRANGSRVCWPSFKRIAADCEMTQRAVIAAVKHLRERSLIECVTDPDERAAILARDGAWEGSRSNLYRILRPLAETEKPGDPAQPPIYEPSSPSEPEPPPDYEPSSPSWEPDYEPSSPLTVNQVHPEGELRSYESPIESPKEEVRGSLRSPSVRRERDEIAISGHRAIVDAWNATAARTGLALVRKLRPDRARKLSARLSEHSVDEIIAGIEKIGASAYCHGAGENGWRADFDFLLQPKSCERAISGFYDDRPAKGFNPANLTGAGALLWKIEREKAEKAARQGTKQPEMMEIGHG